MQKDFQGWYAMMIARAPAVLDGELEKPDAVAASTFPQDRSGGMGVEHRSGDTAPEQIMAAAPWHDSFKKPMELSGVGTVGGPQKPAGSAQGTATGKDKYPEEVLKAAAPFLTGDATADDDILGFYLVRHNMVHGGA